VGKGFGPQCESVTRGHRVYCSNRARRRGCGRTWSIYLAETLPRHGVGARILSGVVEALLSKSSVKAAVESLRTAFTLEAFYHLLTRLRSRSVELRVLLRRQTGPPECGFDDPFLQTLAHLKAAFDSAAPGGACACMCSWFQVRFQTPLFG